MKLRTLSTADEVFEALGGVKTVAALTDRSPNAVTNWLAFGRFPANTFVAMHRALEAAGCDAPPSLWRMRQAPPVAHADEARS